MPHTLTVRGDCLSPRVRDGEILVLTEARPLEVGVVAAAELAGGAVLVGEVARWAGTWWLTAQGHVPVRLDGTARLIGVADWVARQL